MARTVSKYAHPLDNGTEEVELWFNQFKYHLVEESLVHTIVLVADSTNADKIAHAAMEKRIVSHFLTSITPAIFNVLSSLVAPQDVGEKTFNELKDTIVSYLSPRPTILAERFKFHIMYQKAEESTQNFLARLRNTAVRCDFTDMGLRLRDQFIFGVNSVNLPSNVSFDGRIVKKHADSLKTRVKPIIELNKQNIPEAVKQQIRNSLEKQVTELSSSESQVQAPHSSSVPPITEISPQSDTQKSSCNEAQECMSDLPTPGIRRSNRLKLKPKPCYKT